jgi:hypothetical protein
MRSLTSDIPQIDIPQFVEKLTDSEPAGLAHLRESADPVVERVNEALGRSSRRSRPSWPWIVLGVVGVAAVIVVVTRRRRGGDNSAEEDQPVRLAS